MSLSGQCHWLCYYLATSEYYVYMKKLGSASILFVTVRDLKVKEIIYTFFENLLNHWCILDNFTSNLILDNTDCQLLLGKIEGLYWSWPTLLALLKRLLIGSCGFLLLNLAATTNLNNLNCLYLLPLITVMQILNHSWSWWRIIGEGKYHFVHVLEVDLILYTDVLSICSTFHASAIQMLKLSCHWGLGEHSGCFCSTVPQLSYTNQSDLSPSVKTIFWMVLSSNTDARDENYSYLPKLSFLSIQMCSKESKPSNRSL